MDGMDPGRSADRKGVVEKQMKLLKEIFRDRHTALVFRMVLGLTFLYASLDKIAYPQNFSQIVYNYKILPSFVVNIFAITLPWVELICGLFLIGGIFLESSSLLILILLAVFTIATSFNVFIRGIDIQCGCFTASLAAKKQGAELLFRDVILLLMSVQVFLFNQNFATLPGFYQRILYRWLLK
jgi:putative oxidoreductase